MEGFVEFAVPPVGVVYQFKLQFGDGVTDRVVRFHFDSNPSLPQAQ
jgi:hypothetical protein